MAILENKKMCSIVITNYNRQESLIKAISSVLNQTYKNFELIVVDDCSTDNSLVEILKIKDKRIKVFQLIPNSGVAAARNFGIKKSGGRIISFLDSDDYLEPYFLETSILKLQNSTPNVGFMWTGVRYHLNLKKVEFSWAPRVEKNSYHTFLTNLQIGTGAGISIKREVFEKCGYFDEELPAAEDTEFFLRITKVFDFTFSREILINIFKSSKDRISNDYKRIALAYNKFLSIHFDEIDKFPHLKVKYYYKMMWLNYHLGDQKTAIFFYNKIPKELRTFKIAGVKLLYDLLPLKIASFLHQNLSS